MGHGHTENAGEDEARTATVVEGGDEVGRSEKEDPALTKANELVHHAGRRRRQAAAAAAADGSSENPFVSVVPW